MLLFLQAANTVQDEVSVAGGALNRAHSMSTLGQTDGGSLPTSLGLIGHSETNLSALGHPTGLGRTDSLADMARMNSLAGMGRSHSMAGMGLKDNMDAMGRSSGLAGMGRSENSLSGMGRNPMLPAFMQDEGFNPSDKDKGLISYEWVSATLRQSE